MNKHAPITEAPQTAEVHVRVGTPDDVHGIMDLALTAVDEAGYLDPSPEKLLENIWAALNLHHGICGVIGEPGKQIEAAVLLRIGQNWYSTEETLEERSIFVRPEFRNAKGGRASKLLDFSMTAARALGFTLAIGVLSTERTAAKVRLYTRKLGQPNGAYWLYNNQKIARAGEP